MLVGLWRRSSRPCRPASRASNSSLVNASACCCGGTWGGAGGCGCLGGGEGLLLDELLDDDGGDSPPPVLPLGAVVVAGVAPYLRLFELVGSVFRNVLVGSLPEWPQRCDPLVHVVALGFPYPYPYSLS